MMKIYFFPFGFALWSFVSFGSQRIGKKGRKDKKKKKKPPPPKKKIPKPQRCMGAGRGEGSKLETPWNKQK